MNRSPLGALARPGIRRGLVSVSVAAALLAQACAAASSSPSSHASSPSASAPASSAARSVAKPHHHHRKPIEVRVRPQLFGVHDTSLAALSRPGVGAIRLWDAGVTWRELEPQPGVYDFARLDQMVERAHANHTEVMLVLAGTPAWAAADPRRATWVDPPRVAAYQSFVRTVMQRYRSFDPDHDGHGYRGIADYQVWNEPNIKTYWTGTLPQMAGLVRAVWQVRQQVDKGAKVIAPSMVTRLAYELKGIKKFYSLRVAHKPVWKYVDATTFSLYPVDRLPGGRPAGPEDMMTLVRKVRAALHHDRVPTHLPVWNSEVNYGLPTGAHVGSPTPAIPDGLQVAYVMRTYLLSAAAGVKRVYWYRYDLHESFANTFLTSPSGALTPAGQAFFRVQRWMAGTLVGTHRQRPCAHDRRGTYACVVRYRKGTGRIYWNPRHTVRVTTVRSSRSWEGELGVVHPLKHRTRLRVGPAPVLVRSRR